MRLLPGSLYGRMVLVLAASLLLSQGASLLVNFFDRGSSIYRLNAEQMVNRIARTASLINRLPQNARQAVVAELGAKSDFRVQLVNQPIEIESGFAELNQYEKNFAASIRDAMHPPLLTTVEITRASRAESPDEGPIELRRLIARFNETQERIRRYIIERSSLLAAISHDLRTPITRMRLRAELLPEAQRAKFIHDLKEMEDLVGSSLDLFADLGKSRKRYPVDINALLDGITTDWTDTGHQVLLTGRAHSAYPTEPSMLKRAINNLVSNGIRYGKQVEISIIDSPRQLRIFIRDHGPGIPEADRERVFEPFVRLEPSRNRDSGGSGIGMAISRNIARWHQGDIYLDNAIDGGLIAELRLPRRPDTSS